MSSNQQPVYTADTTYSGGSSPTSLATNSSYFFFFGGCFLVVLVKMFFVAWSISGKWVEAKSEGGESGEEMKKVMNDYYFRDMIWSFLFFGGTVFSQFWTNTFIIQQYCSLSSLSQGIKTSLFVTFIPWIFLFGVMMCVLFLIPDFKSVFSNIIGYSFLYYYFNRELNHWLKGTSPSIPSVPSSPSAPSISSVETDNLMEEEREKMEGGMGSTTIRTLKELSDKGPLLMNLLTPENFESQWNAMFDSYPNEHLTSDDKKSIIRNIFFYVCVKQYIGELIWYLMTGLLVISVSNYYISMSPCSSGSSAAMISEYQKFVASEATVASSEAFTNPPPTDLSPDDPTDAVPIQQIQVPYPQPAGTISISDLNKKSSSALLQQRSDSVYDGYATV
jgi:hypothetical protein